MTETAQYKWQFNWVEIFERLEGPFEGNLKYVLRDEAPNDRPALDFVKPKFYLPAASHPVFELAMYKGTPRKIAYNFSNFNLDGYNPEMCYMDWPPGNLMPPCTWLSCKTSHIFNCYKTYSWNSSSFTTGDDQEAAFSGFSPQLIWDIENCANVTEDTYNVTLGEVPTAEMIVMNKLQGHGIH